MDELREVFELVTRQIEPDADSWTEQEELRRRHDRSRRLGALALVAALALALGVLALASLPGRGGGVPAQSVTPPASISALAPDEQDAEIVDLHGNPLGLVPGLPDDAYGLSLSSDGTTIAFVTGDGLLDPQIATIGIDGTRLQVVPTEGIEASVPAWSPDGKRIAFEGRVAGEPSDIYVMNADGSGLRKLTDDPAYDQQPQWSPDGTTIAYDNTGDRSFPGDPGDVAFSPTAEIWTIPAVGGAPTRLTHNAVPDNAPSYSRDGRIAWWSDSCDGICVMDLHGTGKIVRYRVADGFTPRWSPDGTKIAYATYDDRYRPSVRFGGVHKDAPLVIVSVLDVRTGRTHTVGDVGMATDYNTPQWVDDTTLLIRRVGYP